MALHETPLEVVLEGIPSRVAYHFANISRIPRASGNEAGVRKYVSDWARENGFQFRIDEAGNIAIDVPATPGYEDAPLTVLQVHMDMVCDQVKGGTHDFQRDPIRLARTGDLLHSEGHQTTLGADDGVGLAIALAIAENRKNKHGPLTVLCTVDEEGGLAGAKNLGPEMIQTPGESIVVLNIDAEEGPHEVTSGSAGGNTLTAEINLEPLESIRPDSRLFEVKLEGLKGGHSGTDVDKGHGNAVSLLSRLMETIVAGIPGTQFISFDGGAGESALPGSAKCQIAVPTNQEPVLAKLLRTSEAQIRTELGPEPTSDLSLKHMELPSGEVRAVTNDVRSRIVSTLAGLADSDGVLKTDLVGYPLVSTTTAMVRTETSGEKPQLRVVTHSRAAMPQMATLAALTTEFRRLLVGNGFSLKVDTDYTGWQESEYSPALQTVVGAHQELHGTVPNVRAYHAGMELGELKTRIEKTDPKKQVWCVGLGPRIDSAHTVGENLKVSSVAPTVELIEKALALIAQKGTQAVPVEA